MSPLVRAKHHNLYEFKTWMCEWMTTWWLDDQGSLDLKGYMKGKFDLIQNNKEHWTVNHKVKSSSNVKYV